MGRRRPFLQLRLRDLWSWTPAWQMRGGGGGQCNTWPLAMFPGTVCHCLLAGSLNAAGRDLCGRPESAG